MGHSVGIGPGRTCGAAHRPGQEVARVARRTRRRRGSARRARRVAQHALVDANVLVPAHRTRRQTTERGRVPHRRRHTRGAVCGRVGAGRAGCVADSTYFGCGIGVGASRTCGSTYIYI